MVYGELRTKIGKGKETVGVVESLLVFTMAAFYFAVVAGRVWTDQLVPDPKACSGQLKACGQVSFAIGETVGKFEAVICLDTFDEIRKLFHNMVPENGRGIGVMLLKKPRCTETGCTHLAGNNTARKWIWCSLVA